MAFFEKTVNGLGYMCSDLISTTHGFTERSGGVSSGIFESLNLGVRLGDEPQCVSENYRRVGDALSIPINRLVRSHQVHRDDILIASESHIIPLFDTLPYDADGLITDIPNLPLMIYTADCIPLLLYDTEGAVGAVHCGWRSTVLDIPGKAVRMMNSHFGSKPANIRAAIGAGISLCCFETGDDVVKGVTEVLGSGDGFVFPCDNGKYMVDLKGVVKALLIRSGVTEIDINPECTVCCHDKYWSHRFTGGQRGIQSACIML